MKRPLVADSLAHFLWAVHPAGYQISLCIRPFPKTAETAPPGRFLIPAQSTTSLLRRYAPLTEHPGLFRTFADTPQTPEGILKFANLYGFLGMPEMLGSVTSVPAQLPTAVAEVLTRRSAIRRREGIVGESVDAWCTEIGEMAEMLATWEAAQKCDRVALAKRIAWPRPDEVVFHDRNGGSRVIAHEGKPELLHRLQHRDVLLPARVVVQQTINQKLEQYKASAQLLWNRNWSDLEVSLVPGTLLGCLWLQFARAIDGQKSYRACEHCRRWFEIGGGRDGSRSDKRYCCGPCKAAAHAKKKVIEKRRTHDSNRDHAMAKPARRDRRAVDRSSLSPNKVGVK